jgi:succinate-semialdehyde dehydrogenase/glutarate-semialdehyde dehydrogenase
MQSINPATERVIEQYDEDGKKSVHEKIKIGKDRYESWSSKKLQEREQLLSNAADVLDENKQKYAKIMTREMGKPIEQSISEVEKCAWVCNHYAENANRYLADKVYPSPPGVDAKTVYEPLGGVLAVMPWNYPFWQVFRFAAPYTTVGNVGFLKHASSVPGCSKAIEEVFTEAGYPDGVFQSLLVGSSMVEDIVKDDFIKAVTLTGSGPAGSAVAKTAGEEIKKSVLELGGSDPYIVLQDANIEAAVENGTFARNQNNGQSCIAAKRFIVVEDRYEEFLSKLKTKFENLIVGNPMNEDVHIGPQAEEGLMRQMHEQVRQSVEEGAKLEVGGKPMERDGFYYPPTILTNVPDGCPADKQEVFGPVAAVYEVEDVDAAIQKANDTPFGLGASVWTENYQKYNEKIDDINAGCVYVNEIVKSDPRVPFGGVGVSGYGRELSEVGIKEFSNKKTVWISDSSI